MMRKKLTFYNSVIVTIAETRLRCFRPLDEYEFEVRKDLMNVNPVIMLPYKRGKINQNKIQKKANIFNNIKANTLRIQKKNNEALIQYDKAIELDSQQPSFNSGKEMNRLEEAQLEWQKAIDIESSNSNYYSGRAYTLRQLNRNEEAIISYDLVIQRNPQNYEHPSGKGYSLRQQQRNIEAIDSFDSAISIYADDAYIYA
ncbi:unnamed protein product [Paramecium octaurelia]|uniref:Tetratricopeptide repeat protein n=2 Tax=Paramecium octaurelia TaxID=43137 RepID=A0A8S1UZR6_PAROT|nr:unnamed protein product [Paramecium octaurelia]